MFGSISLNGRSCKNEETKIKEIDVDKQNRIGRLKMTTMFFEGT